MGTKTKVWVVSVLTLAALLFVIYLLLRAGPWLTNGSVEAREIQLPLLAIAGVVALLASLTLVSLAFSVVGSSDRTQALALPEGSIRAVLALSLVVLFAIISVYLYSSLTAGELEKIENLQETQKEAFLRMTPGAIAVAAGSLPAATPGAAATPLYAVYFRDVVGQGAQDFAKQLLVLIGTLVTSVASFYFGAKAASGASPPPAGPAPAPKAVSPPARGARGSTVPIEITGGSLQLVDKVRLAKDSAQVVCTNVFSNANVVRCNAPLDAGLATGSWDVIVTDTTGMEAKLPGAFTIS
jgi:hypothetical protein